MPEYRISAKRLTPGEFADDWRLTRACRTELLARGFRVDLPAAVERNGDGQDAVAIITQEPAPGRLPNNHPVLWPLLQRIAGADAAALGRLQALLMAEGDDRAEYMGEIEVGLPEETDFYADTHTQTDGHSSVGISGAKLAERELCKRVLLLFGIEVR